MKLATEFYRLPLQVNAARLVEEVNQFVEQDWRFHPQGFAGNSAIPLLSVHGGDNDEMYGPMLPTPQLQQCPYMRQILASFNSVIGRSRLMRLAAGHEVTEHSDLHYYWRHRVRVHIPIITDTSVQFFCNHQSVHMEAGEVWLFDNWKMHAVKNNSKQDRIHLVFDTCGSSSFWRRVADAEQPVLGRVASAPESCLLFQPERVVNIPTEQVNYTPVMHPSELDELLMDLLVDVVTTQTVPPDFWTQIAQTLEWLQQDWRSIWSMYGEREAGRPHYQRLLQQTLEVVKPYAECFVMRENQAPLLNVLKEWLAAALLPAQAMHPQPQMRSAPSLPAIHPSLDRPVFIIAAPRSGSTLLFETLARSTNICTIGDESHQEIESIPQLHPATHHFHSNRLTAADYSETVRQALLQNFSTQIKANQQASLLDAPPIFLEKTPKNALRVSFLRKVFPRARFIFLHRTAPSNIGSIMDAWKSGCFVTYPQLPGWEGMPWSLLLPPDWQTLPPESLVDIAAHQWACANQYALDDLHSLSRESWCALSYEDFLTDPEGEICRLCQFMEIPFDESFRQLTQEPLPYSRYTLSQPKTEKWRKYEREIETVLPKLAPLVDRLDRLRPVRAYLDKQNPSGDNSGNLT